VFGEYPVGKILSELSYDNLLPAILFRTARKQCDNDIENLASGRSGHLSLAESGELSKEIDKVIEKYHFEPDIIRNHAHFSALVHTGAGAHHAGQLLMWRLLLEELMSRGKLRLLIATGTVAAGVDFPARTVVITAHSKRGSEGFNVLTSAEFQQMSGRAGRRGRDSVGFCLVAPGRYSDARVISEVTKRPPEPLRSAYFASPSTVLNLLKFRNVDDLRFTVSKSLASFLDRKAAEVLRREANEMNSELENSSEIKAEAKKKLAKRYRRKLKDADEIEARQIHNLELTLSALSKLGHLEGSGLAKKGYWAAELCTTLVLELAEAIDAGVFYDLSPLELSALVASIAGDSHRPYFSLKKNPLKPELFVQMQEAVDRVKAAYERASSYDLKVLPDAALTVMTWMECETWAEFSGLLKLNGVADGDVARLVSQTADHLNQICKLYESHTELARAAGDARRMILKPPLSEAILSD